VVGSEPSVLLPLSQLLFHSGHAFGCVQPGGRTLGSTSSALMSRYLGNTRVEVRLVW